tara:strand:- start:1277 stop:1528 length:252 start_codon:yes stop_codon:yes gene_type:complete
LDESQLIDYPDKFEGNASIPMISVNGKINNDFNGPIKMTPRLKKSPYIKQIIALFGEVIGRSCLMRLAPDCEVPIYSETNYHW